MLTPDTCELEDCALPGRRGQLLEIDDDGNEHLVAEICLCEDHLAVLKERARP